MVKRSSPRRGCLLALVGLAVAACQLAGRGDATQPPASPTATAAAAVQNIALSNKPRNLAPAVPADDLAALASGNQAFAVDLYEALRAKETGNLFYSPFSISLALAMTYAGARGETEQQMAQALHFDLPPARLHPAFNALDLALTQSGAGVEGAFQLRLANGLWGQDGYPLEQAYLDTLAVNYGAGLHLADFIQAAPREQARQEINQWVSDQTNGRIEDLIAEGALDDATRLVLANAIYFKADWRYPFDPNNTRPAPFTRLDGTQIDVPTMGRRGPVGYFDGSGYEAISLDYMGDRARMVIVLPAEGQYETVEGALAPATLDAVRAGLAQTDLLVTLPRFSFRSTYPLSGYLAGLGMPAAFQPSADFSGLVAPPNTLAISQVIHKAFVAVDEKGTEAAAATGVMVGASVLPQSVHINRPFIFYIEDFQSGTVLFMGRVLDPGG